MLYTFAFAITFAVGFTVGFSSHAIHKHIVTKAVRAERSSAQATIRKLKRENEELRAEKENVQHLSDCADAMRRGKELGRYNPATPAEQFAKTFADRKGKTTFVRTDKQSA